MKKVDLYDFKFNYRFKKGDEVTYNKVIFKTKPYPFNGEVFVTNSNDKNMLKISRSSVTWNWWELEPIGFINKCNYWIRFYIWWCMRFAKL